MKLKTDQLFLIVAILCGTMCMTSCDDLLDAIFGENIDNPTQPTTQPTTPDEPKDPSTYPATIVKATDLLQEAQKEGATVIFWYHYEGDLFYAAFKKVSDEYVYQEGGNCNKASTRGGVVTTELTAELLESKGDQETADLGFNVYSTDAAGKKKDPIILDKITTSTAEVEQKTSAPNNYLAAMGAIFQNASIKKTMDEVKEIFNGDKKYQPDIKDTENVLILTLDENNDQPRLKSITEILQDATNLGIPPEKAIGAEIDNLQQKVKEDYENGSSKIATVYFKDENPSKTWSSTASENTYLQELQTDGVMGTVTYSINSDNTCGATIDASTGKVTFTKAGSVTVTAKVEDTDTYTYATKEVSYTLTVNKAAGSISYATSSLEKLTTDAAFTNTLTKTGDGKVTYSSNKESVASVDSSTGEVTIKGVGEATITATVADSDTYTYATKTATYKVNVVDSGGLEDYNRNNTTEL